MIKFLKKLSILYFIILFCFTNVTFVQCSDYVTKGIDVSNHNGVIDWKAVKNSGIGFAIIRTSYGWSDWDRQTDRQLFNNINGAKAVGMPIGAYHYSYATTVDEAIKEADFFLDRLKFSSWEYPVFLDMEDKCQENLNTQERTTIVLTFLEKVKKSGYHTGLYANSNWVNEKFDMVRLKGYELWVSDYNPKYESDLPCSIWQYSCSGNIPGIERTCDLNYSYKNFSR